MANNVQRRPGGCGCLLIIILLVLGGSYMARQMGGLGSIFKQGTESTQSSTTTSDDDIDYTLPIPQTSSEAIDNPPLGTISISDVNHNAVSGDQSGMAIKCAVDIDNPGNVPLYVGAYFCDRNGNDLMTNDGAQVSTGEDLNLTLSGRTNIELFMPVEQLNLPSGHHDLLFYVALFYWNGNEWNQFANSDWYAFSVN